jgi:hypothetical protein
MKHENLNREDLIELLIKLEKRVAALEQYIIEGEL